MTYRELIADRIKYVREEVRQERHHSESHHSDKVGLAETLTRDNAAARVAVELVLQFLECPAEHWRGDVEG